MIQYKKRRKYKYTLHADFVYPTDINVKEPADLGLLKIDADGRLTIRAKYSWDGPSGPAFDTKSFMKASLIHDALYQLIREEVLQPEQRKEADEILRRICEECDMFCLRRWWVYYAVRIFAAKAAKPDVLTAP